MNMVNALSIDVFRTPRFGDCTNGGISSRFSELLIVCEDGPRKIDLDNPPENACKMVKRHLFGQDCYHIEPLNRPTGAGWMAGGNFAYTSDSRFSAMCGKTCNAISIHDRQETWDQYNMYN